MTARRLLHEAAGLFYKGPEATYPVSCYFDFCPEQATHIRPMSDWGPSRWSGEMPLCEECSDLQDENEASDFPTVGQIADAFMDAWEASNGDTDTALEGILLDGKPLTIGKALDTMPPGARYVIDMELRTGGPAIYIVNLTQPEHDQLTQLADRWSTSPEAALRRAAQIVIEATALPDEAGPSPRPDPPSLTY